MYFCLEYSQSSSEQSPPTLLQNPRNCRTENALQMLLPTIPVVEPHLQKCFSLTYMAPKPPGPAFKYMQEQPAAKSIPQPRSCKSKTFPTSGWADIVFLCYCCYFLNVQHLVLVRRRSVHLGAKSKLVVIFSSGFAFQAPSQSGSPTHLLLEVSRGSSAPIGQLTLQKRIIILSSKASMFCRVFE